MPSSYGGSIYDISSFAFPLISDIIFAADFRLLSSAFAADITPFRRALSYATAFRHCQLSPLPIRQPPAICAAIFARLSPPIRFLSPLFFEFRFRHFRLRRHFRRLAEFFGRRHISRRARAMMPRDIFSAFAGAIISPLRRRQLSVFALAAIDCRYASVFARYFRFRCCIATFSPMRLLPLSLFHYFR